MSIPFKSIKTKLGLDDELDFGRYKGLTIFECIQERNGYIDWLISQGKQFYPSVHQELNRQPFIKPKRSYFYDGSLRGDMAHYTATQQDDYDYDLLGDWFDDVPF